MPMTTVFCYENSFIYNLNLLDETTKLLYAAAIEQTGVVPSMYGAVHLWMVALTVIL